MLTSENKTKLFIWLLAAIVVLAFAMRFPYLGISPLCDDEAFTVYYASRPLSPWKDFLWGSMGRNGFPPLDFILHHTVFTIFGTTAATARYVPTFFDTLTVLFLGLLGFKLANRKTGLIAALLWALAPCTIYYAKESRLYAQFGFAVTLYLFSLSLYLKKYSWKRLLFVFLSLVYGFNVSTLFTFVMIPAPFAVLLYYSTEFFKNRMEKAKTALWDISLLIAGHAAAAVAVYGFYKFYSVPSGSYFKAKITPKMYTLLELAEKFVSRINQAFTIPDVVKYLGKNTNANFFLVLPLFLLVVSLVKWKKDTFIKLLVFCFLFYIPLYDIITLYYGGQFSGWTHIRHIYFIVPIIYLGIAYSYDILFNFTKCIFDKFFVSKKSYFSYILSLAIIFLLIVSCDIYAMAPLRTKVQKVFKSDFNKLYNWLDKCSSIGKVYVIDRVTDWTECRELAYLCSLDYKHSTNINYVIPTKNGPQKFNKLPPNAYNLSEEQLKDVVKNKSEFAYIYSASYPFPYDKTLFDIKLNNSITVYRMKPIPDSMTVEQYKGYSNIFKSILINNWKGTIHHKYYDLISGNADFSTPLVPWKYWRTTNEKGPNLITIDSDESNSFVRIDNHDGKLIGLFQTVNVNSGSVYRIIGESRIPDGNNSENGGRISIALPNSKEQEITFLYSSHSWGKGETHKWAYKELIFTNQVSGTASLIVHTGYGNYKGKTDFKNVRLEEIKTK
jgi:uncharacterized membrane protein